MIVCRKTLTQWKRAANELCPSCKEIETVKHIYFECPRIKLIWLKIGSIIQVDLTWKKILFGYLEKCIIHEFRNLLFTVILYAIFKAWNEGIENDDIYIHKNIMSIVKADVLKWKHNLEHSKLFFNKPNLITLWNTAIKYI